MAFTPKAPQTSSFIKSNLVYTLSSHAVTSKRSDIICLLLSVNSLLSPSEHVTFTILMIVQNYWQMIDLSLIEMY